MAKLTDIKQVHAFEAGKTGRPKAVRTISKLDELARSLVTALDMTRYQRAQVIPHAPS